MSEAKEKLLAYLDLHEDLPDALTIEKILNRGFGFKEVSNNRIEFLITRHPGFAGRPSLGKHVGLPALWNEETRYTVNLDEDKWDGELLSREFQYDAYLMATDEVDKLEDGGFFSDRIEEELSDEEIIEEAVKVELNYLNEMQDDDIQDTVWSEMLKEFEAEFRKQASESIDHERG